MGISVVQQLQSTGPAPPPPQTGAGTEAADDNDANELTFDDLIDVINPLHHLPIVSTIYRAATGDQISNHARAIGGGLYGGPIGLITAGATMAVEEAMGLTASDTLASLFSSDDDGTEVAAMPAKGIQAAEKAQAAAATTTAPAGAQQATSTATGQTMPFTARRGGSQFFTMSSQQGSFALPTSQPLAKTAAPSADVAQAQANGLALTRTEGNLLDAFIRRNGAEQNAQAQPQQQQAATNASPNARPAGPPPNADGAWFANQMEANLQKYANAQAHGVAPQ